MENNSQGVELSEHFPSLAAELSEGLTKIDERALADSIEGLRVFGRCECGQRNCGTFYARPRNEWDGQALRQVIPAVHRLMAIDIHADDIVCVEFLDRPDVVAFLDKYFGQ